MVFVIICLFAWYKFLEEELLVILLKIAISLPENFYQFILVSEAYEYISHTLDNIEYNQCF